MADDPALTRAKEHQRIVSQAEYTGKRKESSSQLIHPGFSSSSDQRDSLFNELDQHQHHQQGSSSQTNSMRNVPSSEATVGRGLFKVFSSIFIDLARFVVADYDPLNDDRGSLARGYEPTSKAMHATSQSFFAFLDISRKNSNFRI